MRSGLMAREQVMRRHLVFILRLLLFFVATRDGISSLVNFKERGAVQVATSKGEAHCPRPDFLTPTLSYL